MDVLGLLLFFAVILPARIAEPPVVVDILFDEANPLASVAIMKDEILQEGDFYRNCRIISFEPGAVVARENETEDTIKWIKEEGAKPRKGLRRTARHLFAVKQMKIIYETQVQYLSEFKNGFAEDLQTLLEKELLPDGFQDWQKLDYRYELIKSGFKRKLAADQKPEPYFYAVASPLKKGDYYFAINELGVVRFSKDLSELSWAPVWDYADRSGGPRQQVIR